MKIPAEALYERLTEADGDDVVAEVLAMSPEQVRAELRDLGYHLPTTRANIRRRASFPPHSSRSGYIRAGLGVAGLGGIGTLVWAALMAAPMLASMTAAPPNDTVPVVTAAAAPPPAPIAPITEADAGADAGDDER
jgi:hypothetical protein